MRRLSLALPVVLFGFVACGGGSEGASTEGGAAGSGSSGAAGSGGSAAGAASGGGGSSTAGSAGTASTGGKAGSAGNAGKAGAGGTAGASGAGGTGGAATVKRLQIVVKTGDQVGDGTDDGVKLCLHDGAGGCFALDNTWVASGAKHDDFQRGVRDHFDFTPDGLAPNDVKYVSLDAGTNDAFTFDCVAVVADGELLYCKDDLGVTIGTAAKPTWKDTTLEKSCGSCYRKGSKLTHGPMIGHTTKTSASVWLRTGSSVPVQIRYAKSATLAGSLLSPKVTGDQKDDFTLVVPVEGLEPGTTYHYTPVLGGTDLYTTGFPTFTTAPAGASAFTVAFGSCSNFEAVKGNPITLEEFPKALPVFDEIEKYGPDLFLLVGDNHYGNTWSPRGHAYFYRETRDQPQFAQVIRHVPTLAVWDDHDFGTNNSDGADHPNERDGALESFGRFWANAKSGATATGGTVPGIWFKTSWGGVDFFMLDDRYYREGSAKGDPNAAMLGKTQIDWLLAELGASKAKFKVVANGSMWSSGEAPGPANDSWGGHPGELQKIVDGIDAAKVDGVVLLSGDKHRSAAYRFRDGTAKVPPIYELMASGLSGAENNCLHTANELACVDFMGPTYGRIRFQMDLADPVMTFQIAGPEFGVWKDQLVVKASALVH